MSVATLSDRLPPPHPCPNCGAWVDARFCGSCGQRSASRLVSVRRLLADVLDDQFSLNAALPRTAAALMLHPGRLTCDYVAGRIVRYIPPFRLYLLCSLLFFVVLAWRTDPDEMQRALRDDEAPAAPAPAAPAPAADEAPRDGQGIDLRIGGSDTTRVPRLLKPFARHAARQEARFSALSKEEALRLLSDSLMRNAPRAVFVLVPVFALLLKLLYFRRRRLYVEHFVFSLHVHAFAFVLFTVVAVAPNPWVIAGLFFWFAGYLFWAMRRVYGQSLLRTALKYGVLVQAYMIALSLVLTGAVMVAILTV